jgi:hypothetical protein
MAAAENEMIRQVVCWLMSHAVFSLDYAHDRNVLHI